ncbi:MAG: outer membrane protein assembly factor BamA [Zhongshania sp.]|jgi:outer membrane protein assembly factor BamA
MRNTAATLALAAIFGLCSCPPILAQANISETGDCSSDNELKNNDQTNTHILNTAVDTESNPTTDQAVTINSINIDVKPIFDESNPKENNWLFRLANRLHIPTRKKVIRDDLLFATNDPLNQHLLNSSERTLNTRRYLNESTVNAEVRPCSNKADVTVAVRLKAQAELFPIRWK